jgi:hypothetical protein
MLNVLCYPEIVPDPNWLKLAGLYWDRVYRISSAHYGRDEPEIEELNAALGGVLNSISVDRVWSQEVEASFHEWLDEHEANLSSTYDPDWFTIFPDKVPSNSILTRLEASGLCRVGRQVIAQQLDGRGMPLDAHYWEHLSSFARHPNRDRCPICSEPKGFTVPWQLEMQTRVACEYFSRIALAAAEELGADLFANNQEFARSALAHKRDVGCEVAIGVLQAYMPANLDVLNPLAIREFRYLSGKARLRFQKEIASLISEFSSLTSERELKAFTTRLVELGIERVSDSNRAYKQAKLDMVLKSFGVALTPPALVGSLASMLHVGIFVPAAIAATVALFGAQMLLNLDRARMERDKNAWSYVLKARAALGD